MLPPTPSGGSGSFLFSSSIGSDGPGSSPISISPVLMMSFSLPLLGTLPLSAVAERVGAPAAVGGASVLAVVVALLFYLFSPALRELDERVRSASSES